MNHKHKNTDIHSLRILFPYIILILLLIVAVLAMIFTLQNKTDDTNVEPQGPWRNYYNSDQIAEGGEALNDVSISNVDITQKGEDLIIEMQFHYNNASTEGSIVSTNLVPSFVLSVLPQPHRLCLTLENVTQWEFTGKTSWLEYKLLQGVFVAQPTYETADNPTVIFHLSQDVAFRVQEDDGTLRIHLRTIPSDAQGYYHVVLNGLSEYAANESVRTLGLTPTLCSDTVNTLLISEGFASEEEAQSFITAHQNVLDDCLPGKTAWVCYLQHGELPDYPQNLQMQEMENMPIVYRDGAPQTAEVLEINANVLASSPTGDSILCYSPVYSLDQSTGETLYSEILYISNETDSYEKLVDLDFAMILYAQYSPNGRYIGFLDYNSDANITAFYCYDSQTQTLMHINENDFGTFVYDFVWDPSSSALYAVTLNEDGSMCIRSYDFISPDGQHVSVLKCLNFSGGMLGATQDAIYYADTDAAGANAMIYRMDKLTGESVQLTEGKRFILSGDGTLLAAETPHGLNILRLSDDESVAHLPEAVSVWDFRFSADSKRMFAVVDTNNEQERYPGDVYMYDVERQHFTYLFSTSCTDLDWSLEPNCVLVNFTYATQTSYIPVTYRVRL